MQPTPVLVIDDDPYVSNAISTTLSYFGCSVRTARNRTEALEAVRLHRPSLVFLDLDTPSLDGPRFARELRARGMEPPIVAIGPAEEMDGSVEDLGAAWFLPKHFGLAGLLSATENLLSPSPATAL